MNVDKLLSNKKLLLAAGGIILTILIVVIILLLPNNQSSTDSTDNEDVDDRVYMEISEQIGDYISANHPIDDLLPIRNESPFYYITLRAESDGNKNLFAVLEISYYTDEGKQAAETRLKSSDFAAYHPENYSRRYVDLNNY